MFKQAAMKASKPYVADGTDEESSTATDGTERPPHSPAVESATPPPRVDEAPAAPATAPAALAGTLPPLKKSRSLARPFSGKRVRPTPDGL